MVALRAVLGVLCGTAAAALGALMLGEYEFTGALPFVAGPMLGVAIGEVVVAAGQVRSFLIAAICAALGFGSIVWAGWIDSSEGLEPLKGLVWVAAVLAALGAAWRAVDPERLRRR